MNLLLFLGAGVSIPSGLPSAAKLTTDLLAPSTSEGDDAVRIRQLLTVMAHFDAADIRRVGPYVSGKGFAASGAIYRGASPTYEDLFFLCEEIALWSIGLPDNCLTTPFMKAIVRRAGSLLPGATLEAKLWELGRLCRPACEYIASVAAGALQRPYLAGFELLGELATAPGVSELNIATLNHDGLVEQFLSDRGIDFADGFGEADGDVRWSRDQLFDEPSRVRLFKLHGSTNWYDFHRDGRAQSGALAGGDIAKARDGAGRPLVADRRAASFISGLNKPAYYNRGIYADMHFRFAQALRRCDRMVMSGYGWGDAAISFQLGNWLDRAPANRLVLLHEGPEALSAGSMLMATCRDSWVHSGQLVCVERWLCDTRLSEIEGLLQSVPRQKATVA